MLSYFVAVCLALLPLAQCIQIHKYMAQEEVLKTFQTGHDNDIRELRRIPGRQAPRNGHSWRNICRTCSTYCAKCHRFVVRDSLLSAAAEVSFCGNELHCINGYCVSKEVKHVPYKLSMSADPFEGASWFNVAT